MKHGGRLLLLLLCALTFATETRAAAIHRRALLVGIDDYSASHLPGAAKPNPVPGRDYPNLGGAVNDVTGMAEMLPVLYGVSPADILTLTNQKATRAAILEAIETHLLKNATNGDVLLFYYSGHGSQVANSLSSEPDKLDESIVPADSRLGALDIRDKELRARFNKILDRGARLTVILDSCHSASGARGLPVGARPRGVKPDRRDVADGASYGKPPEERGALIIAATEDYDLAWEARDEQGKLHGAFSLAWMRALRSASSGEPAADTFLRAQARLCGETPYQEPVIAGNAAARLSPFFGPRIDRRGDHAVVAVEKIREDGTVVLQGGWANGLAAGCELRPLGGGALRLKVSAIHGLVSSEATANGRALPQSLQPGTLLEVVGWAMPPGKPLRVWMPRAPMTVAALAKLARSLVEASKERKVRWISDPLSATPMFVLRWRDRGWELLDADGNVEHLGAGGALSAIGKLPPGSSLFTQFPAPTSLLDRMAPRDGVEVVERGEEAQYVFVGRFAERKLQYAWVRPTVKASDRRKTSLPLRTSWTIVADRELGESAAVLRDLVGRLRRIYLWNLLESPPEARSPYRLAIIRSRDGEEIRDDALIGGEKYGLALRRDAAPLPAPVPPRFIYVFTIDSFGRSVLLFPRAQGSVENRFPLPPSPSPAQSAPYPPLSIPLGSAELFEASSPFGIDTYFLLSTDEPLPDPWILESDGVRTRNPASALEELLMPSGRSATVLTAANWSIEKLVRESVVRRSAAEGAR